MTPHLPALVRRGSRDDLPALVELEAAFASDRISRRSFARLLTRPSVEVWVYAEGSRVLGSLVLLFRAGEATGRVYSIVVRADARRRGIASCLLTLTDERCRARGCRVVRLEVRADDREACDFYRTRGYVAAGELPTYYADGATALRLKKDLPDEASRIPGSSLPG